MEKRKRLISLVLALAMVCSLGGALFVPASAASLPFTDIGNSPYYDSIEYVYNEGIMNGITTTTFEPETTVTRAMFVTTLYRMAGQPVQNGTTDFVDVEEGRYYYNAVVWANENDIVNGMTVTTFEPDRIVTIQQALTFLYRFANYQEVPMSCPNSALAQESMGSNYENCVHNYASEAVTWAMNCGILSSKLTSIQPDKYESGEVNSAAKVSRELCARFLHRYVVLVYSGSKVLVTSGSEHRQNTGQIRTLLDNYVDYGAEEMLIEETAHVKYAIKNTDVVYLEADGNWDRIYLNSSKTEYLNNATWNCAGGASLIYLSGSKTSGEYAEDLVYTGLADSVIGFTSNLTDPGTASIGVNYFDLRCLSYWVNGYSSTEAIRKALLDMSNNNKSYMGADSATAH